MGNFIKPFKLKKQNQKQNPLLFLIPILRFPLLCAIEFFFFLIPMHHLYGSCFGTIPHNIPECTVLWVDRFFFFLLLHIQCRVVIGDRFPPTKAPDVKTFPNIDLIQWRQHLPPAPPSRVGIVLYSLLVYPSPPVKGNIFPGCRGSLIVSKTEGPVTKQNNFILKQNCFFCKTSGT